MESRIAEDFLKEFNDNRYPKEFTDSYEAMECMSKAQYTETLLVREKRSGRLLIAKCYEKGHYLFESTEPEVFRSLSCCGLPAFVTEMSSSTMRCILREYVEGKTLWEKRLENPFTQEEVCAVGMELCRILKYLHNQIPPVIHRDIKPQNVIMNDDGLPVLIDLGISRLYMEGAQADTVFCGTQAFAPPEQYGFLQTDCRSDIYSLGILLTWMLTGKTEPIKMPQTMLEVVIAKCTAFAPEKRLRNAAAVERALQGAKISSIKRKKVVLDAGLVLVSALLISCGLLWKAGKITGFVPQLTAMTPSSATISVSSTAMTPSSAAKISESGFTEPLIEKAVRLMLNKGTDEPVLSEELQTITEIYITHDVACADMNAFYNTHEELCKKGLSMRSSITSLEDLKLLPNLRILCVAAQQIQDISPLKSLPELFQIELRLNSVLDITPLKELENLTMLGLNSNPVLDISPLAGCGALKCLDLCGADYYDGSALAMLGNFDFLDISNSTDSYLYLAERSITELKLSKTALTDLSCLHDVSGIQKLEVCGVQVTDLSEIGNHPEITYLRLCDIPAKDFSVVLKLPVLETVLVSASAKKYIEPVALQGTFKVKYE